MLAPSLFISHGSPMFAVEPGPLGVQLNRIGQGLSGLQAVVVVSPHWQTPGNPLPSIRVSAVDKPKTVHDFFGFPQILYELQYAARGFPDMAARIVQVLMAAGFSAAVDNEQGLDHGVWVPLMHLLPKAQIPVICVSLPLEATPEMAFEMGQALAGLREHGIAIIGSGSMTHNLSEFRGVKTLEPQPYVVAFTEWVRLTVIERDVARLLNYRKNAPAAARAHPTEEHFLPLFVAFGASGDNDRFDLLETEVRHGMLSMESYGWGLVNSGLAARKD